MERINRVKGWLDFANKDISCAKHLLGMRPVPLEIVCYHSEQAAEEALKGYLLYQNIEPSQTQDLGRLCSMCLKFDKAFEGLMGPWERLARYCEPIYPFEMQISNNDMKTAIADADRVMAFVLQRLRLPRKLHIRTMNKKSSRKMQQGSNKPDTFIMNSKPKIVPTKLRLSGRQMASTSQTKKLIDSFNF